MKTLEEISRQIVAGIDEALVVLRAEAETLIFTYWDELNQLGGGRLKVADRCYVGLVNDTLPTALNAHLKLYLYWKRFQVVGGQTRSAHIKKGTNKTYDIRKLTDQCPEWAHDTIRKTEDRAEELRKLHRQLVESRKYLLVHGVCEGDSAQG